MVFPISVFCSTPTLPWGALTPILAALPGSIVLACLLPSALSVPEDSNQSRYLVPWAFCISTFAYFPSNYVQLLSIDGHQHQFDSLLTYRCSNYLHNLWLTMILFPSNGTWQGKQPREWCNNYHLEGNSQQHLLFILLLQSRWMSGSKMWALMLGLRGASKGVSNSASQGN